MSGEIWRQCDARVSNLCGDRQLLLQNLKREPFFQLLSRCTEDSSDGSRCSPLLPDYLAEVALSNSQFKNRGLFSFNGPNGNLLWIVHESFRNLLDELLHSPPNSTCALLSGMDLLGIYFHLKRGCDRRRIQFTRGRPYKKDDDAHIEQKNWTHVRKIAA